MSPIDRVRVRCNAKVNLYLKVLDRRPDGYHNIETVFHSISLADDLELTRRDSGFSLCSGSADIPHDRTNLAAVAARELLGYVGGGVRIDLDKRIPVSAGLGGGSADAAGSLVGVNRLYGLGLSHEELAAVALRVGSDVPFMLRGGCALGEGRGEILTPLRPLPPLAVVVVVPPLSISTAWAYASLKTGLTSHEVRGNIIKRALEEGDVSSINSLLHNDFESLVFEKYPEVGRIKDTLLSHGAAGALMSGSGPAVFGIFTKEGDAGKSIASFKDGGLSVFRSGFEGLGVSTYS